MNPDLNQKSSFKASEIEAVEEFARAKKSSVLVILFDDIESSTVIKQKMAEETDEAAFQILRREHDAVFEEILGRDNAGKVIKSTGDGVMAVLTEPSTAVERAIEIQQRFSYHPHFRIRIGLDMGQVRVEKAGGVQEDLFGRHVDWSARVTAMAKPGHILVTRVVFIDAFGWIPKSKVIWKEHGYFSKKVTEQPLEVFEPYGPGLTIPMDTPNGIKSKQQSNIRVGFSGALVAGTASMGLMILTLGAVIGVINGAVPLSTLSATTSISIAGSFLGIAFLLYRLIALSIVGRLKT